MPLPSTIIIGPTTIQVKYLPIDDEFGNSREHPPQIEINDSYDLRTQTQTLLHEVFHHVSWMYGLGWSERFVRLMELVMVDLVQENPGLFRELLTRAKRPAIDRYDLRSPDRPGDVVRGEAVDGGRSS